MIVSAYLNYKELTIKKKIQFILETKLDGLSFKEEDLKDLEAYKNAKIQILNCELNCQSYLATDKAAHQMYLEKLGNISKSLKDYNIKTITTTIPKVNLSQELELLNEIIIDYYNILKKNKVQLVLATSTDYKANEFAYILKNNKKVKAFSFDCDKFYRNNHAVLPSFKILKEYIKILKVSDRKENIPVLIGYGNYKLIEIFKTLIKDNKQILIEMNTNLLELEKKPTIQAFFSKKIKKQNSIYRDLEAKIGEITLEKILINQAEAVLKILK